MRIRTLAVVFSLLLLPSLALLAPPACRAGDGAGDFALVRTDPGLSLHKEMFMLPFTYSDEYHGRHTEAVFQLSAKHRLFGSRFYAAYTQISFWQAYDYRNSSPFRDTNYNPEIFYRFERSGTRPGRLGADAGLEHESNGQLLPLSRSWNLLYVAPWYERGDLLLYAKLRYRVPEKGKTSPADPEGDDNPDITDYLGHSDLHAFWRFAGAHQLHLALRGVIGSGKGNVSLAYSCPMPRGEGSFLFLRLSHGYGESLMDYRHSISRVGVGVAFTR